MEIGRSLIKRIGVLLANKLASRQFWRLYGRMEAFDRADAGTQKARHQETLCSMLKHAGTRVPMWRDEFSRISVDPEKLQPSDAVDILSRLPVTNKAVYKRGYPHRTTSDGDRKTWRFLSSSGTIDRLTVITDLAKRDYLAASLIRVNKRTVDRDVGVHNVEIPPQCCNVRCQLPDVDEGVADTLKYLWKSALGGKLRSPETMVRLRGCLRQVVLPRKVLLPIDPLPKDELEKILDQRIDQVAKAKPLIIRALPVYLVWLAERLIERNIAFPTLRAVLPWGGLVTPSMARRIERGFGVPFHDVYGATELGEIGISCGTNGGLHVLEDLCRVEILDKDGSPVAPGEKGRITVTDFTNRAMPMIRYQVGDIGYFIPGACECGRKGLRLVVCGRDAETVWGQDHKPPVTAYDLLELFFRDGNVMNFRVEELPAGSYAATVVGRNGVAPDGELLASGLKELLRTGDLPEIRVSAFVRPEKSGKYRFAHPIKKESVAGQPAGSQV